MGSREPDVGHCHGEYWRFGAMRWVLNSKQTDESTHSCIDEFNLDVFGYRKDLLCIAMTQVAHVSVYT